MFGPEIEKLATQVLATCRAKGVKIATAESCTGGLIIASLTEIAGSSDVVDRGFITYTNEAKSEMLGVSPQTLAAHSAVSAEVVNEMSQGALDRSGADLVVAVSGIAGPGGGSAAKPVGLVHFAVCRKGLKPTVFHDVFQGGRSAVRQKTVVIALQALLRAGELT